MADENIDIRARLIDRRKFQQDTLAAAGSIKALDEATDRAGRSMHRTSRRSFLMNQALFTVRRIVYDATLTIGAMSAAVALLGLNFNRTMEENTIAMKFMLGSQQAATAELEHLYDLAARTPFEFQGVTEAARRFLGWGFTIDQTNRYLESTADAMAAMGGNTEIIERVIRAFGQMRSIGRVMGEELLQLTDAQIPAYEILKEELGLTGDQMRRIADLQIPADVAIEALVRGMNKRFGGAAEELSRTVTGQLSTLRDFSRQMFGMIMTAPFEAAQERMPALIDTVEAMTVAMRDEGFFAMVRALDEGADASGRLYSSFVQLHTLVSNVGILFRDVLWPAFRANWEILWYFLRPVLLLAGGTLGIMATQADLVSAALATLIFFWMANKFAIIGVVLWQKRWVFAAIVTRKWMRYLWVETAVATAWTNRLMWSQRAGAFTMSLYAAAVTRLTLAMRGLVTWIIRLVVIALAPVAAALGVTAGVIALVIAAIAALGIAIFFLVKYWDQVSAAIRRFIGWVRRAASEAGSFMDKFWFLGGAVGTAYKGGRWIIGKIPGLADGGRVASGGVAMVGERGPELVRMPQGAAVEPMRGQAFDWDRVVAAGGDGKVIELHAHLYLDGREVAENVFKHRLDRIARR